jgi:hypothetical protein
MSGHFMYTSVVVPATAVIPLAIGAFRFKELSPPLRIIFYYVVFAGIIDGIAAYYAEHRMNNLWLLHTYTAIETVLLLWFYLAVLKEEWMRRAIPFLMVAFPLVCLANILWWQSLLRYNTYTRPVEAILLIYTGLVYFFENSHKPSPAGVSWMNAGVLLYFSVSFFIFIFSNYLVQGQAFNTFIQVLHATFVLLMYALFAVGFYKCRR